MGHYDELSWKLGIEPSNGRASAHHGIRGVLKELIGRELPFGGSETKQWSQASISSPMNLLPPSALSSSLALAEFPLDKTFNFCPRLALALQNGIQWKS